MSLPQPPKKLIDYLPNGKTVCFDHHLRRYGICWVDFTYGESDEDDPYHIDYQDDSDEVASGDEEEDDEDDGNDEEDDRVFVLRGGVARFMPQWDHQVLGAGNAFQIKMEYDNPPKPLPRSESHYLSLPNLSSISSRIFSHLLWYTSIAACLHRWRLLWQWHSGRARWTECLLGPGSKFSFVERLMGVQTKAELATAARSLEAVRAKILLERRIMVTGAKGSNDPRTVKNSMNLRLVLVTNSSYIVEGMCRHCSNWKENNQGALVNKAGKATENSEGFLRLRGEVKKLSRAGVHVAYYLVVREENKDANILAKGSIA
ncbi:uncharacterized protein PAC_11411 [Phialocephala subalpina]|uniref:Uncharacterized protein n=1 Tax=Phialocephala subalpina TaxID=576137 RepID=A0A1L7X920_9HELO|nr:uncharacterized protein PAC_11411 [Phialocephala subalpina]